MTDLDSLGSFCNRVFFATLKLITEMSAVHINDFKIKLK